jgi:predicted GNAT family acetyltransferase
VETPTAEVLDDGSGRLSINVDDEVAYLAYRREPGRLIIVHTEVPTSLEGRGLGGRLVGAAVALARADALEVVPWCPFARHWLSVHKEAREGLGVDWRSRPSPGGRGASSAPGA